MSRAKLILISILASHTSTVYYLFSLNSRRTLRRKLIRFKAQHKGKAGRIF